MSDALPNPEAVLIHSPMHPAIRTHRDNPHLELMTRLGENAQAAGVAQLSQRHRHCAAVEDVAAAEFRQVGLWAGGHPGLIAPHGLIILLPGLLPGFGD